MRVWYVAALAACSLVACSLATGCSGPAHPTAAPAAPSAPSDSAAPSASSASSRPSSSAIPVAPTRSAAASKETVTSIALYGQQQVYVANGNDVDRSIDDGTTWQRLKRLRQPVSQLAVITPQYLRALGRTQLYVSDDGGAGWLTVAMPTPALLSFSFASATAGLGVGANGTLERTADGGRTWRVVASPTNVTAVAAVSPTAAWVGTSTAGIFHTADGRTWQQVAQTPVQNFPAPGQRIPVLAIQAAGPGTAFVLAGDGSGAGSMKANATLRVPLTGAVNVLDSNGVTGVGGTHQSTYPGLISAINLTQVAIAGYSPAAGDPVSIEVAGERGTQTHVVTGAHEPVAIAFSSAGEGWLSGDGQLLHTTDGGGHFESVALL